MKPPEAKPILRNRRLRRAKPPLYTEPSYSLAGILSEDNADSDDISVKTDKAKTKMLERMKKNQADELGRLQAAYEEQQKELANQRRAEKERRDDHDMMVSKGRGGDAVVVQLAAKKRKLYNMFADFVAKQGHCHGHGDEEEEEEHHHHHHDEPSYMGALREYLTTPKDQLSEAELANHPGIGLSKHAAEHKLHDLIHGAHKKKDPNFVKHQ